MDPEEALAKLRAPPVSDDTVLGSLELYEAIQYHNNKHKSGRKTFVNIFANAVGIPVAAEETPQDRINTLIPRRIVRQCEKIVTVVSLLCSCPGMTDKWYKVNRTLVRLCVSQCASLMFKSEDYQKYSGYIDKLLGVDPHGRTGPQVFIGK